jgi:hypothetical protein
MVMPYYEYEYIIQNLIDILEKKKEAEEGNDEKTQEQKDKMMSDAKAGMPSYAKQALSSGGPKMPSGLGSGSMPSFPSMPSGLKI